MIIITIVSVIVAVGCLAILVCFVLQKEEQKSVVQQAQTPAEKPAPSHRKVPANPYSSFWYSKYQWVYFLRGPDGEIVVPDGDWRISKIRWEAAYRYNHDELTLPAEIIRRTKEGAEALVEQYFVEDGITMQRTFLADTDDEYGEQHLAFEPKGSDGKPFDPSLN